MADPTQIRIDIVSDVVCPWCVIGYKQLERAIGRMGNRAEISIRWHPFELAPNTPPEGQSLADYSRERYGATPEQMRGNRDRLRGLGEPLGITFNWSDTSRIYNSNRAHQLLLWAGELGRQTALKLELFSAYFTGQGNIADDDVLLDVVERAGLDRTEAAAVLHDARFAAQVEAETEFWQDRNVTGVPAYVIDGSFMVPGAQDADTFVNLFERVIARRVAA